jgi:hypothetical protein
MQTAWPAFGLESPVNVVTTAVLTAWTCRVRLNPIAGVVTLLTLPASTQGVRLYTADDPVRYAVDEDPELPSVLTGSPLAASVFVVGDTLLPNQWQLVALPNDSLTHIVHLTSQGDSAPTVLVVALVG